MITSLIARRVLTAAAVAATATLGVVVPADGAGISVKPNSNLVVGAGTYAATVSAPKGTFPKVPDPAAVPSSRTVTTKVGAAGIVGAAGTFTAADIGSFVEDGAGGRLPDGVDVTEITPLVAVYPRQGLAYIKAVNLTGTTATLSQKATGAGAGAVSLVTPATPILLITQTTGSIPFIADIPVGLCLIPFFPGGVCGYTSGNLAHDATKVVAFANPDGSFLTPFTITEGVMDGVLGTNPGPVYVKIFDPDDAGPAPTAPFAVPSSEPGSTARGCAPDLADRSIPNPAIGGVDYCMVNVIVLNAGVQSTKVPYSLSAFPLTWAASAGGFMSGSTLAVTGSDFANNDVIVKIVVANGKAKVTGNPLVKCPALNQIILGTIATGTGDVLAAADTSGCTVPSGSLTKVTLIGSKDVQQSQIPPNAIIGTNAPKKASKIITMP